LEISQNKSTAHVRLREGEVNIIGGIIQQTNSRATTGIPGLGQIPFLGRLFSGENTEKDKSELVIALIPHIVRGPDVTDSNLKGVAAGNATQIKVGYAPRTAPPAPPVASPAAGAPPATAPPTPAEPAPPVVVAPGPPPPAPIPEATEVRRTSAVNPLGGLIPQAAQPGTSGQPAAPATAGATRAAFVPARVETQLSSATTVTLNLDNVADMQSVAAHLQYDPRILRVVNIVPGDLPQRNAAPLQPVRNILNDVGQADVLINRSPADGVVSGSGAVMSIIFQAVGRGDTQVSLSFLRVNSPNGQPSVPLPAPLPVSVK
jgi:general secretion pathway protein D